MQTKTKLLLIVTVMLLTLGLATIINVALNFREYSIQNASEKARMTASIVKDGLTAHMVNDTMDKRDYFLDQISKNDDIQSLWLVRSQNVVEQYGHGFNTETSRDSIDKKVLDTGIIEEKIVENANGIILRVTIPYKADTITKDANCLSCHNVQRGDTLGAISMEFDISDTRTDGMLTLIKILGINLLFTLVVLIVLNKYLSPYTQIFSDMQKGVTKAYKGDFTHKFLTYNVKGEVREIIEQMNTLFEKMHEAFGEIKFSLTTFIPSNSMVSNDPLCEAKIIISELSDIYKFKKTIELDISKEVVYSRIVKVLHEKYDIGTFTLYEVNNKKGTRNLVYLSGEQSICLDNANKDATFCRAHRTKTDVISTEFSELCKGCCSDIMEYICIPFSINEDTALVVSITTADKKTLNTINMQIPSIKNYFEAAKPVIEGKLLMEQLRDTSLRDGMTGLYNRRFLEEFIDKVMSQVKRDSATYSVMMLDVDFFKSINDTYGHDVGDKVIIAIAKLLQSSIRESDLAIRYGGEEFLVMLHNASEDGIMKIASKIHQEFAQIIFDVGMGETIQKTMSIGISKFPQDADSIWKCIKFADNALYKAKTTGRNKIVFYIPEMSEDENIR